MTTLEKAKAILNTCRREELRDHAFGDAEVYWYKDGKEVAFGYFGSLASVGAADENGKTTWVFEGQEARALRSCGALGAVERNDETGPAVYAEGQTLPSLTSEGVVCRLPRGVLTDMDED